MKRIAILTTLLLVLPTLALGAGFAKVCTFGGQELNPNSEDPTGVRVTFTNLPQAINTIQIFTVSGDLVQTISHSGLDGSGQASWNLMSRNGQEIVSGVYLYTVQSDDSSFEDFVGKFVVVR